MTKVGPVHPSESPSPVFVVKGYFITPLANVLTGRLVLHEKLSRAQWTAVALATLAVLWMTLRLGADHFLPKPPEPVTLVTLLRRAFDRERGRRTDAEHGGCHQVGTSTRSTPGGCSPGAHPPFF